MVGRSNVKQCHLWRNMQNVSEPHIIIVHIQENWDWKPHKLNNYYSPDGESNELYDMCFFFLDSIIVMIVDMFKG